MRQPETQRARRPRIGYITPRISDENGLAIWRGMVEAAQARGVDLLCFVGGEVHHPEDAAQIATGQHRPANVIYDLVDRERLDGLVVWGSSLGYYAGPEATLQFCQRFAPLPLVSFGVAMPGIPGIVVDSYGGMAAAITHLIEVHGRRRLAFIRGPAPHREASERYRAYCDTLAAFGIPLDPDLVSPPYLWVHADGTGLEANGAEAIRFLLDDRHAQFDAVVAANDTFALGALTALQARGIAAPEQVALVGFDDKPPSRTVSPPLTTVQIGMRERGQQAIAMLLARLAGESLPAEVSLPARLVVRRSCGCFDPAVVRAGKDEGGRRKDEGADGRLLDACLAELRDGEAGRFLATLDTLLRQTVDAGGDVWAWQGALSALREQVALILTGSPEAGEQALLRGPSFGPKQSQASEGIASSHKPLLAMTDKAETLQRAESLWHQARVLIAERSWQAQAYADRRASERADRLHALDRALTAAGDVPALMDILAAELPALGVAACAVALYADPSAPTGDCRLVLAFDERGRLDLPPGGAAWPAPVLASGGLLADNFHAASLRGASSATKQSLSEAEIASQKPLAMTADNLDTASLRGASSATKQSQVEAEIASQKPLAMTISARSLVVEPLFFRDEQLGFLMLDGALRDGQVFRVLQEQISSALKGVLLLQENVRLYHTALAAQQVAQEKQRLAEEADRLKSRFLSMVSHELRTPLILLEGLSEMMLRAERPRQGEAAGDRSPLPEPYRQDLERIHATAQQLGGLVRDVLDLARSQMGQLRLALKPLDVAAVLQPTLLVGEQMARSKGLDWRVEIAASLPRVSGDGGRLQEVTLNLISNAVKFTPRGQVRLRIEVDGGYVVVAVSDTGLGVPLDEQEAIFDEFRQSERTAARGFGGLGVGLAICRQLIHLHGGEIGVSSSGEVDGGSTFFYRLPALLEERGSRGEREQGGGGRPQIVALLTDQMASGERLRAHLRERGFEVETLPVEALEDGLARLAALRPGAVVVDLRQPAWERGWQMIDALKQGEETRDIPLLLYSLPAAEDAPSPGAEPLAEGARGAVLALDYVAKPMGDAALAQALQNLGLAAAAAAPQIILIADDDPAILALHSEIVRSHFPHARIVTAADGRQALDFLQGRERPLLVLLDLMMPVLDGIGVLKAMQRDPRLVDIPVIVLTAQRLAEADMGRLGRGVASILQKGMFTTEETLTQIEQALARNRRLGSETQRLVRKAMAYIQTHYAEEISREQLASHIGVSARHLTRCFTQEVGLSPVDYLNRFRVTQARRLLDEGDASITDVMAAVGFGDSSYFSRVFHREVGVSPGAYRRNRTRTSADGRG